LAVVDAIGFAPWLMGDEAVHQKGLEGMKRTFSSTASRQNTPKRAIPARFLQAPMHDTRPKG